MSKSVFSLLTQFFLRTLGLTNTKPVLDIRSSIMSLPLEGQSWASCNSKESILSFMEEYTDLFSTCKSIGIVALSQSPTLPT